ACDCGPEGVCDRRRCGAGVRRERKGTVQWELAERNDPVVERVPVVLPARRRPAFIDPLPGLPPEVRLEAGCSELLPLLLIAEINGEPQMHLARVVQGRVRGKRREEQNVAQREIRGDPPKRLKQIARDPRL